MRPEAAALRLALLGALIGLSSGTAAFPEVKRARVGPCLILHDWFGSSPAATPTYVREHLAYLETLPFDGVALYVRSPDLSINVTTGVMDGKDLTDVQIARILKPVERLASSRLTNNFAAVISHKPPDLFDDWSKVTRNFALLAREAGRAGLKGIYFDNENYGTHWGDYPKGVTHPERTLVEYRDQARLRGREIMEAASREFPEIAFLALHGPYVSELKAPAPLFPTWQASNLLMGPFFAGLVEGRGPKARVIDGGELYHLRTEEDFAKSYEWRKRGIAAPGVACPFIAAPLRADWSRNVDVAFGLYDRPFGGKAMDPETLKTVVERALRRSDGYVWFYVEGPSFLLPAREGGAPAEWVEALRGGADRARRLTPR